VEIKNELREFVSSILNLRVFASYGIHNLRKIWKLHILSKVTTCKISFTLNNFNDHI